MKDFNLKFKSIRKHYRLSQPEFAEKLHTTQAAISLIESGKTKNPSMETLNRLVRTFPDLNPDWLLNDIGSMLKSSGNRKAESVGKNEELSIPTSFRQEAILLEYEKKVKVYVNFLLEKIQKLEEDKEFFKRQFEKDR